MGRIVTSKKKGYTGNSIFLPAAGHRNDMTGGTLTDTSGNLGKYWSSTLATSNNSTKAKIMYISSSSHSTTYTVGVERPYGLSVRAVTE